MSAGLIAALFALATIVVCLVTMFLVAVGASTRTLAAGACVAVALAVGAVAFRLIASS